jgi:hypothetical protein
MQTTTFIPRYSLWMTSGDGNWPVDDRIRAQMTV